MYGGVKEYGCMYGPKRHQTQKEKYKEQRRNKQTGDHNFTIRTKTNYQPPIKAGCPAKVKIRKLYRFPTFQVSKGTMYEKEQLSKRLRSTTKPSYETVYEVSLPDVSVHEKHLLREAAELVAPALPSRKTAKSLAGECRELLDHIRSHTYLIPDQDRLSNLRDILKSASLICKGSTEKVDQLAVRNIQQDSKSRNPTKRPHPPDNTSDSNTELKIRRKRSACSGRVGVKAESIRASIDVGRIYETPQTITKL
ncbi:uncharacterized protein [Watersipora subatra]